MAFNNLPPQIEFIDASQTHHLYGQNTLGTTRRLLGTFKPIHTEQVREIILWANKHKVKLHPISTGRNWGYGSALPVASDVVVVDLSNMKKIIKFDSQQGYVILEPGVTQQDLYNYILENHLNFMVPTTGAGPTCSVLANALEKGYGITPYEDHFSALTSIKAVLADGRLYQSALNDFGGHLIDPVFKWKLGPYIDGLFAQGGLGIVTQGTIALARKSENVTQFLSFIDDENFEHAVQGIAHIKQRLGAVLGGVNLMNKRRLLSMVENREAWHPSLPMSEMKLRDLAKKRRIPDWAIMGGLYGTDSVVASAKNEIQQKFNPFSNQLLFLDYGKIKFAKKIIASFNSTALHKTLNGIENGLKILSGEPSQVALPLAYLKNKKFKNKEIVDPMPDRDGCGLIWFSPLLPIDPYVTRDFAQEVTRICLSMNIEPLVTMTAISERCFDSTIPILFDKESHEETINARNCYDRLIQLSREFGVFPYRLDIESLTKYYKQTPSVAVDLISKIQSAVDPQDILSQGRYRPI